jgi:Flp pilus assembly pilin Flp
LHTIKQLIRDEDGAELVEYGLLVSLIAFVALASVHTFGREVSALYPQLSDVASRGHAMSF